MTRILTALLLPPLLAALAGMVVLWPDGAVEPALQVTDVEIEHVEAVVTGATTGRCAGGSEDRRPDGDIPAQVRCTTVEARVATGEAAGRTVTVTAPAEVGAGDVPDGTRITLERYPGGDQVDGDEDWYAWFDYARTLPLGTLAVVFAVVVVAVARMRGLRALVGLALAFAVIAWFMLPALLSGHSALGVGLVGSVVIMFAVLYLAHGVSHRTSVALLGTLASLALTTALGWVVASTAHLQGIASEDNYRLASLLGSADGVALRGLFLCGIVLASLGVLNDVTVTQASAVWELRAADPRARPRELFASAMRIGRDHIASTVYTIAFAYAGAALPVLLLLQVYRLPLGQTLASGEFAEEVARVLVASVGLVLAIPLTTAIAVSVACAGEPDAAWWRRWRASTAPGHRHTHGHAHAGVDADALTRPPAARPAPALTSGGGPDARTGPGSGNDEGPSPRG